MSLWGGTLGSCFGCTTPGRVQAHTKSCICRCRCTCTVACSYVHSPLCECKQAWMQKCTNKQSKTNNIKKSDQTMRVRHVLRLFSRLTLAMVQGRYEALGCGFRPLLVPTRAQVELLELPMGGPAEEGACRGDGKFSSCFSSVCRALHLLRFYLYIPTNLHTYIHTYIHDACMHACMHACMRA